MEIKRVKVHAHDEPEFIQVGAGTRRLLMWRDEAKVFLLNQPNMALIRMEPERFDFFKPTEEKMDPKATANALEERKRKLEKMGIWGGGKVVDKVIEALRGGEVSVAELDELADTDQPSAKVLSPVDLDAEAKGMEPKPAKAKRSKKSAEPKEEPASNFYEPAMKDRVKRIRDKDDPPELGTITQVGQEQSEVKWDGGASGFEPNQWLVKVDEPKKQKEVEPMAKAAKKSSAKKNGAKAKAEPKGSARSQSNDPIVREFEVQEGSNRHKALKVLRGSVGKKVKVTDISKAVYGNKDSVGKLGAVLQGIRNVIAAGKLPYDLGAMEGRGEEATITLAKK